VSQLCSYRQVNYFITSFGNLHSINQSINQSKQIYTAPCVITKRARENVSDTNNRQTDRQTDRQVGRSSQLYCTVTLLWVLTPSCMVEHHHHHHHHHRIWNTSPAAISFLASDSHSVFTAYNRHTHSLSSNAHYSPTQPSQPRSDCSVETRTTSQ